MGRQKRRKRISPNVLFLVLAAIVVAAAALGLDIRFGIPGWAAYVIGINVATALAYAYDKAVAGGSKVRVPEIVLHLLALIGGTPAALACQNLLRHKTIKGSFRIRFWSIAALQLVSVFAWVWYQHSARR